MKPNLLIVDDEQHTREGLELALEDTYEVFLASSPEEAFNAIEAERFEVVLTDLRMSGQSGMSVIDFSINHPTSPICIMMTAYGEVDVAVEAMKRGAFDFLSKPVNLEKLELLIKRGLEGKKLQKENSNLHQRLDKKFSFQGILGKSSALEKVLEQIQLVGPSKATVLLTGETGTGKELVAQSIHQNSDRSRGPFVPVHCAALPSNLLESELFGHEKGAFTGAHERRIGRFEQANGGTLFLDEIGEIDQAIQVKLLRFLGERTFERVGSNKTLTADVRLIAATNRNLEEQVSKGDFREDLFFRLRVVEMRLPPLRDRGTDVIMLAKAFLKEFSDENGKPIEGLHPDAVEALLNHPWPGNVRELRTAIEHAVVLCRDDTITLQGLPPSIRGESSTLAHPDAKEVLTKKSLTVEDAEKALIIRALKEFDGNRTKAAKKIGMSRRTLHRKLHTYNLHDL